MNIELKFNYLFRSSEVIQLKEENVSKYDIKMK
jgi:hypothetical protein